MKNNLNKKIIKAVKFFGILVLLSILLLILTKSFIPREKMGGLANVKRGDKCFIIEGNKDIEGHFDNRLNCVEKK